MEGFVEAFAVFRESRARRPAGALGRAKPQVIKVVGQSDPDEVPGLISNRRRFLAGAARTLIASAAGAELVARTGCASSAASAIPARRWADLEHRLTGTVLRPGNPEFVRLAAPNNRRYAAVIPAGIARCANARDVSAAIVWAREVGIPLVARSGGHSYGGYSTTSGLMIDVGKLDTMRYDRSTGIATLGGGARNAHVYSGLRPHGVAITHGRCYGVGIAGLVLGGGVGFNMRANGVTSDQLIGTEIVTADGQIHALSEQHNHELFWACRGAGGGNFGIHTAFRFQTFPVGPITVYDLTWTRRPDDVYPALLRALEAAPPTLGCKVSVTAPTAAQRAAGKSIAITLLGDLRGTPGQLADILQPVYRIAQPAGKIRRTGYWEGQDFLSEAGAPEFFHEPSRFFNEAIPDAAIAVILEGMRRWPGTAKGTSFKLFQTGGAMMPSPPLPPLSFIARACGSHRSDSNGTRTRPAPSCSAISPGSKRSMTPTARLRAAARTRTSSTRR